MKDASAMVLAANMPLMRWIFWAGIALIISLGMLLGVVLNKVVDHAYAEQPTTCSLSIGEKPVLWVCDEHGTEWREEE